MDSSFSPKDEIWFLRVCHHISNAVCYNDPSFRLDALDKENALPPAGKESRFRRRLSHSVVTIQRDLFICVSNDSQVKEWLLPSAAFTGHYANVDCTVETLLLNIYFMKIVL